MIHRQGQPGAWLGAVAAGSIQPLTLFPRNVAILLAVAKPFRQAAGITSS